MKLRTQLVLAAVILAVLPLTAIVVYSYQTSRRALESAYRNEAARMTRRMDRRLDAIRADLETRLAEISSLPIQHVTGANDDPQPVVDEILMAMGETAPLVDALEFQPAPAPAPSLLPQRPVPVTAETLMPAKTKTKGKPPRVVVRATPHPAAAPHPPNVNVHIDPDTDRRIEIAIANAVQEPIVIDLPPIPPNPVYQTTPEQEAMMKEIGRLSGELAAKAATMSAEDRRALRDRLQAKQEALHASMDKSREDFQKEMARIREIRKMHLDRQRELRAHERERVAKEKSSGAASASVAEAPAVPNAPAAASVPAPPESVKAKRELSAKERKILQDRAKQVSLLFGRKFDTPVQTGGKVVGTVTAQIKPEEVIRRVLGQGTGDDDEIPFAVDSEGHVYTRSDADRQTLINLGVPQRIVSGKSLRGIHDWIVVASRTEDSGLRVGVARKIGAGFDELRRTAARNFGYGLALVAFALIGIVPFANHITRDVKTVTEGAERIAHGDLMTRLPVKSKNEVGQLAVAFNRMAEDLSVHQQKLLEQERARKEREIQQRILQLEYERKTSDLEEARRFQLSMLPKEVPQLDRFDVAVFTQTATEVGGDYYDFHVAPDGRLTVTIGDATGHGAKAGTMVTVIKTLFTGYAADTRPADFLSNAAEKIKRMDLGRMAMALLLARFEEQRLIVSSAAMPPVLVRRGATGEVQELTLGATPLGTLGVEYDEMAVDVAAGDTVLFMTDGFPELTNALGQQLGYPAAAEAFAAAGGAGEARGVVAALVASAKRWHGEHPPNDDMTFVAVHVRA